MTQHQGQKTAVCRYVVDSRYDAWKPLHSSGKYRVKLSYMEHGKPSALIHYIDSHPAYVNPLRVHELERQFAQGTVLEQLRLLTVLASERERKVTNALQALYPVPRWAYASAELFYAYQRSRWGAAQDPGIYVPYNVISPEHQTHRGRPEVITIEFSTVGVPFRWLLTVSSQWRGSWMMRWVERLNIRHLAGLACDVIPDEVPWCHGGLAYVPDPASGIVHIYQLVTLSESSTIDMLASLSPDHGIVCEDVLEEFSGKLFVIDISICEYHYQPGRIPLDSVPNSVGASVAEEETA